MKKECLQKNRNTKQLPGHIYIFISTVNIFAYTVCSDSGLFESHHHHSHAVGSLSSWAPNQTPPYIYFKSRSNIHLCTVGLNQGDPAESIALQLKAYILRFESLLWSIGEKDPRWPLTPVLEPLFPTMLSRGHHFTGFMHC